MLDAKRLGTPTIHIYEHAMVHGFLMAPFLFYFTYPWLFLAVGLVFLQMITHFLIDLLKGRLNFWFPKLSDPSNKFHWYIFGADQFAHQLVIIIMAYIACK